MDGGQIIGVWKVLLSLLWVLEFVVFSHVVGFGANFFLHCGSDQGCSDRDLNIQFSWGK